MGRVVPQGATASVPFNRPGKPGASQIQVEVCNLLLYANDIQNVHSNLDCAMQRFRRIYKHVPYVGCSIEGTLYKFIKI